MSKPNNLYQKREPKNICNFSVKFTKTLLTNQTFGYNIYEVSTQPNKVLKRGERNATR